MDLIKIGNRMAVNPDRLLKVHVTAMPEDRMQTIANRVIPTFCYDNSLMALVELELEKIVYGIAVADVASHQLTVEHCWVKTSDGIYYDPTYQLVGPGGNVETTYYVLFEMSAPEYFEFAISRRGKELSTIGALDFLEFRRSAEYQDCFIKKRLVEMA